MGGTGVAVGAPPLLPPPPQPTTPRTSAAVATNERTVLLVDILFSFSSGLGVGEPSPPTDARPLLSRIGQRVTVQARLFCVTLLIRPPFSPRLSLSRPVRAGADPPAGHEQLSNHGAGSRGPVFRSSRPHANSQICKRTLLVIPSVETACFPEAAAPALAASDGSRVTLVAAHVLPHPSDVLRMLERQPVWLVRVRHRVRLALSENGVTGRALVADHLALGVFVLRRRGSDSSRGTSGDRRCPVVVPRAFMGGKKFCGRSSGLRDGLFDGLCSRAGQSPDTSSRRTSDTRRDPGVRRRDRSRSPPPAASTPVCLDEGQGRIDLIAPPGPDSRRGSASDRCGSAGCGSRCSPWCGSRPWHLLLRQRFALRV